jgi:hypothetical protein
MSDESEKSLGAEIVEGLTEFVNVLEDDAAVTFDDINVRIGFLSDRQGKKVATIYDPASPTGQTQIRKEPKE